MQRITLGGKEYEVTVQPHFQSFAASCWPIEADAPLWGFGFTEDLAVQDLFQSYQDLIEFIDS